MLNVYRKSITNLAELICSLTDLLKEQKMNWDILLSGVRYQLLIWLMKSYVI